MKDVIAAIDALLDGVLQRPSMHTRDVESMILNLIGLRADILDIDPGHEQWHARHFTAWLCTAFPDKPGSMLLTDHFEDTRKYKRKSDLLADVAEAMEPYVRLCQKEQDDVRVSKAAADVASWLESLRPGDEFRTRTLSRRVVFLGRGEASHYERVGSHIESASDPWKRREYDVYRPTSEQGHVFATCVQQGALELISCFVFEALSPTEQRMFLHDWGVQIEGITNA